MATLLNLLFSMAVFFCSVQLSFKIFRLCVQVVQECSIERRRGSRSSTPGTRTTRVVRVATYFRSHFLESCKYIHFWKGQTFLKPKTNVSI